MADYTSLVTLANNPGKGKTNDVNTVVVQSNTNVTASIRLIAAAMRNDPGSVWVDATVLTLPETLWTGWTLTVNIFDTAGDLVSSSADVGLVADSDIDDLADRMVILLNATDDIANAAYSTPNLTIASGAGGDDLGDYTVTVTFTPPDSWEDQTITPAGVISTITHEGSSTDALAVLLLLGEPPIGYFIGPNGIKDTKPV